MLVGRDDVVIQGLMIMLGPTYLLHNICDRSTSTYVFCFLFHLLDAFSRSRTTRCEFGSSLYVI
jgi:hypothetical protein